MSLTTVKLSEDIASEGGGKSWATFVAKNENFAKIDGISILTKQEIENNLL